MYAKILKIPQIPQWIFFKKFLEKMQGPLI
jgi:hypothetical protein